MENKLPEVPYIALDSTKYKNETSFWSDVGELIRILTKNGYQTMVSYEDCGIYRLDFVNSDLELGKVRFVGLTYDQHEYLLDSLCQNESPTWT